MSEEPRKDAMLSYAPAEGRRLSKVIRYLLVLLAIAVLGFAAFVVVLPAWRRTQILYHQHRLMRQSIPASVIVWGVHQPTTTQPADHDQEETVVNDRTQFADWYKFRALCRSPASLITSPIYTHSITDRHGSGLLITVQVQLVGLDMHPELSCEVIQPGTFTRLPSPASVVARNFVFDFPWEVPLKSNLDFYAGQPDPEDHSHFTIDYELNGQRHTLDGYIDDQDVLKIEKRKEPTTRSALDARYNANG